MDCVYVRSWGRRKTWMVPSQLLIGAILLLGSTRVDALLYAGEPQVGALTLLFLAMNFLCATQDIAVDGWALTMIKKENAAYQATCNAAGQTLGFTLGWTGVTLLEQLEVSDLAGFMFYTGLVFIAVTLAVAWLKPEAGVGRDEEPEGILQAYQSVGTLLQLAPVKTLLVVLFTWKLGFAVVDSVAPLKFQEYGVPKAHLTYLGSLMMPLEIALPLLAAKWTSGGRPFDLALRCYPWKVALVPLTALCAYLTPAAPLPTGFWLAMLALALVQSVTTEWMFVSQIALFAKVSDPAYGGTYMSLLNTMANLGQKLPPTATFFLVDALTCRDQSCTVQADGFYVMTAACTAVGSLWYAVARGPVRRMQDLDVRQWRVAARKKKQA